MNGRGGVGVGSGGGRFPFTASQWQELEHQALIFKYMASGVPIPPDLLFTIRRYSDSSSNSKLFAHPAASHIGWSCFQMGLGRKIDPEPGRCRRTDGKKWRCAKEAFQDSKYCEKHMHRGKNRSRKHVEQVTTNSSHDLLRSVVKSAMNNHSNKTHSSLSSVTSDNQHHQYQYPPAANYYSNNINININNTHPYGYHHHSRVDLGLDSGSYHSRYGSVLKDVVDEHSLLNEECAGGSVKGSISSMMEDSWQLTPLAISTSRNPKDYDPLYLHHRLQLQACDDSSIKLGAAGQSGDEKKKQQYYESAGSYGVDGSSREKTVYRFLEERPPSERIKESWLNNRQLADDKSSNCSSSSTTDQLSISISTAATSHHVFPIFNSTADFHHSQI